MTVKDAFRQFIRTRYIKGLSDKTIKSYQCLVSPFLRYIGDDTEMEDITQDDIEDYLDSLYARPLSRSTVATYIRNARIFLKWYEDKYDVEYTTDEVLVPRSPKKVLHLYTPDEIKLIFQTIDACAPWLSARNRAMVALMLDSGIRQGEVCSLLVKNVDFDSRRMKVCGKGNKERFVPLGHTASRLLNDYLALRPYEIDNVFVGFYGEKITPNAIKTMTWNLQKLLPFEFSSHKLRHNFATNYLLDQYERFGQMDIYQLMAIMGHEDIKTTQRYLHEANSILAVKACISHLDAYCPDAV